MKKHWIVMALLGLQGCSVLAGLFPDKQKQYQYSTEIPPLEIPPDLLASTIQGARQSHKNPQQPEADRFAPTDSSPADMSLASSLPPVSPGMAQPATPTDTDTDADTGDDDEASRSGDSDRYVLAESSDGTPLIEINQPYPAAWNTVGRALGRLKLEISDQNRSDGLYYVYHGERSESPPEHGLLSELMGFITGKPTRGQEFRLRVEEHGQMTYVMVVDDNHQPIRTGEGLELLKQLYGGLQKLSATASDEEDQP